MDRNVDVRWALGLKAPTGFQRLDSMLGGGVKLGSLAFVVCDAAPIRDVLLSEIAVNELRRGYGVIYVSAERPAKEIEQRIAAKIPVSTYTNLLYVIDMVSAMLEDRYMPPIRYMSAPNDFRSVDKTIEEAFTFLRKRGIKQQVVIFDSLDKALKVVNGYMNVYKILLALSILLEGYAAPGFFSIDAKMHPAPAIRALNELAGTFLIIDPSKGSLTAMAGNSKMEGRIVVRGGQLDVV